MVKRIDVQAGDVDWDDDQRLIVDGKPYTGEAVTCNWLDEVTSLATCVEGFREGVQREWYDGGQLKSEMTVRSGRMTGATRCWDRDGNLVREERHDRTALVKLAPEWGTGPLWVDGEYRDLDDFGLSDELVALIEQWNEEFQSGYDADDPPASGFPDEKTEGGGWTKGGNWPGGSGRRWCSRSGVCGRRSTAETLRLPRCRRTGMPENRREKYV